MKKLIYSAQPIEEFQVTEHETPKQVQQQQTAEELRKLKEVSNQHIEHTVHIQKKQK